MKVRKYNYIALIVLALGFSACTEECDYSPAEPINGNCIKASFSSDGEYLILPAEAENKVSITAEREKTDGESTVALRATNVNDSHFQVPQSMTFAAGESKTSFNITFSDIELEEEYIYSVAMDESAYDPYNANTLATTSGTILKKHIGIQLWDRAPFHYLDLEQMFLVKYKRQVMRKIGLRRLPHLQKAMI